MDKILPFFEAHPKFTSVLIALGLAGAVGAANSFVAGTVSPAALLNAALIAVASAFIKSVND